ncbi:hypothetical protein [Puniceibacterium sediminis]|uniref:Dihydroxy-acid dehydratase n=1 Tax=Puniceibacterium sediminis TaxID=1608407 RepID=A0A238VI92_9RHOB|nr:hypothetical protein [Puniceibacterium sediminis]SNR33956.1 hypothetical protein SAMN06265370_102207 [Puniceibacterium sediminis]
MRVVLGIAILTCLWAAGCSALVPSDGGTQRGFLDEGSVAVPLKRATLGGGDVRIAGPTGYCVDPETLRIGSTQSFALLASCRILSGGASGPEVPPFLIAVTVGAPGSGLHVPEPQRLATAASAPLLEGRTSDGLSLALLGTGGDVAFEGGETRYWRGAFAQGGRLVGLALYVRKGDALQQERGPEILQSLQAQVRADSPKRGEAGAAADMGRLPKK